MQILGLHLCCFFSVVHSSSVISPQILAVLATLNSELSWPPSETPALCLESPSLCHSLNITPTARRSGWTWRSALCASPLLRIVALHCQCLIMCVSYILSSLVYIYLCQADTSNASYSAMDRTRHFFYSSLIPFQLSLYPPDSTLSKVITDLYFANLIFTTRSHLTRTSSIIPRSRSLSSSWNPFSPTNLASRKPLFLTFPPTSVFAAGSSSSSWPPNVRKPQSSLSNLFLSPSTFSSVISLSPNNLYTFIILKCISPAWISALKCRLGVPTPSSTSPLESLKSIPNFPCPKQNSWFLPSQACLSLGLTHLNK